MIRTLASPREAAEQAVLGAILLTPAALDIVADEHLHPDHFHHPAHRALLHGMLALRDQGRAVDTLTLKARFDSPQSPVTAAEIDLLAGSVIDLANIRDYCRIVRDHAWFDRAERVLYDAHDALKERDREGMLAALGRLDHADTNEPYVTVAEEFTRWYDSPSKGWPLPFQQLNESTGGGLQPGETTILGGWSGFGKTFLLSQMLRHCVKAGAKVHEYANEMHGPKRTARTLTAMTGIPASLIERKKLTPEQVRVVLTSLKQFPYETSPTAGWRVEDYCRDLRRHKWDVAAVDTVTNLPCSRVDEWDRACVMLADAAAQAGTHLIEVSQLNLERDKGKKPPPVGRDIRNTGAWYQRARVVLFVHRDQESVQAGDGSLIWRASPEGHIRIDKASHGDESVGFVPVRFNTKWLRFDEIAAPYLEAVA